MFPDVGIVSGEFRRIPLCTIYSTVLISHRYSWMIATAKTSLQLVQLVKLLGHLWI